MQRDLRGDEAVTQDDYILTNDVPEWVSEQESQA